MQRSSIRAASSYDDAQRKMAFLVNYYRWIYKHVRPYLVGQVLELGCGAGHFLHHYVDQVEKVYAVDHDPILLSRLEEKYSENPVSVIRADLRNDWNEFEYVKADIVLCMDILEHIQDDDAFVKKAKARLRPCGLFIIKVPAQSKLFSEIDRASGHYRRYDKRKLRKLFEANGFSPVKLIYMNPVGSFVYRMKNSRRTTFSKTFSRNQLRMINLIMMFLPVLDRVPGLKGLSLIGIFRVKSHIMYDSSRISVGPSISQILTSELW